MCTKVIVLSTRRSGTTFFHNLCRGFNNVIAFEEPFHPRLTNKRKWCFGNEINNNIKRAYNEYLTLDESDFVSYHVPLGAPSKDFESELFIRNKKKILSYIDYLGEVNQNIFLHPVRSNFICSSFLESKHDWKFIWLKRSLYDRIISVIAENPNKYKYRNKYFRPKNLLIKKVLIKAYPTKVLMRDFWKIDLLGKILLKNLSKCTFDTDLIFNQVVAYFTLADYMISKFLTNLSNDNYLIVEYDRLCNNFEYEIDRIGDWVGLNHNIIQKDIKFKSYKLSPDLYNKINNISAEVLSLIQQKQ